MKYRLNILPVIKKEFKQIRRDVRTLIVLLLMPSFLLIMVGYALNFDIKHIPIYFFDEDKSQTSGKFIDSFNHSEFIDVKGLLNSESEIDRLLESGKAIGVIVIPYDFSENIHNGNSAVVQLLVDGANANTASNSIAYINAGVQQYSNKIITGLLFRKGVDFKIPIDIKSRLWYNPELKSSKFLIPGLFGMILMLVGVISTSLSIVREKEQGTMEQIMVSPLKSMDVILGKTIPYLLISIIATTFVLIFSALLFDVKVEGSLLLFYTATILFMLGALGQGLLISTIAETQAVAFLVSVLSSLLPTFLLSGFVFPIKNMPVWLQLITHAIPAKYYLVSIRSVMVKGTGFEIVWEQLFFLLIFSLVVGGISIVRMHKDIER